MKFLLVSLETKHKPDEIWQFTRYSGGLADRAQGRLPQPWQSRPVGRLLNLVISPDFGRSRAAQGPFRNLIGSHGGRFI